jgi:hypothetical protein
MKMEERNFGDTPTIQNGWERGQQIKMEDRNYG